MEEFKESQTTEISKTEQVPSESTGKRSWIPYLVWSLVGLAAAIYILVSKEAFQANSRNFVRILSDAFFTTGVLLGGGGLLVFFTQRGTFDALRYSFGSLFSLFKKDQSDTAKYASYSRYKESKAGQERIRCRYALIPAAAFLTIGTVLTIVFYMV